MGVFLVCFIVVWSITRVSNKVTGLFLGRKHKAYVGMLLSLLIYFGMVDLEWIGMERFLPYVMAMISWFVLDMAGVTNRKLFKW
ncbi:hypothetical protein IMZ31_23925 (plasmid) [Pontibacillus sp. ALD_SL1]|uniref:hypothetical protein n=1 Tax=Pontibacillus sp. ALD_SL1 TaxID=2777185 RepID=UPI001A96F12C|nr:hypothetical protein [Pontibacillus sp. ALD_SL1]QST02502.1 hypothetical protein IMZ31_23925 [Pontibacillus sp. ALD_SL1]